MSKYDQEVEARLKKIEEAIEKLTAEKPEVSSNESLERKVNLLEYMMRMIEPNFEKLSKKFN